MNESFSKAFESTFGHIILNCLKVILFVFNFIKFNYPNLVHPLSQKRSPPKNQTNYY